MIEIFALKENVPRTMNCILGVIRTWEIKNLAIIHSRFFLHKKGKYLINNVVLDTYSTSKLLLMGKACWNNE